MNNKITIALIIAILAGFGGLVIWTSTRQAAPVTDYGDLEPNSIQTPNNLNGQIGDHLRGKTDSKVVFMEYADMMCAGCAGSIFTVESLFDEYQDRVAFGFRHYPIQGHPNSRSAAAAVESAGMQGHFWEMLKAMYVERNSWLETTGSARTDAYVEVFKRNVPDGDADKFKKNLGNPNIENKINYDHELGVRQIVMATPSFYVNGKEISLEDCRTQMDIKNKIAAEIDRQLAELDK